LLVLPANAISGLLCCAYLAVVIYLVPVNNVTLVFYFTLWCVAYVTVILIVSQRYLLMNLFSCIIYHNNNTFALLVVVVLVVMVVVSVIDSVTFCTQVDQCVSIRLQSTQIQRNYNKLL